MVHDVIAGAFHMASHRSGPTPSGGFAEGEPFDADEPSEKTVKFPLNRNGPQRKLVMPTLRVVAGRDMLRFVTLQANDSIVIGRDESGGLVLSDASVSRRHARVACNADGTVQVQDLGSTNGTAVNGHPVERALLRPGDHLEVGAVSLRLDLLSYEELAHLTTVIDRLAAKNRDPLTGLLTRAYIDEDLPAMMDRARASRTDLTCIFLDVDRFKSINDRFGHQVGDDVLVGVSRLLMVGVRDTDACVRYGGEEVMLFLQGTSEQTGMEVAERTRRAIQGHDWTRTAPELTVTASFGVAQWNPGEPAKAWFARADRALYAAKERGRNRSVSSSEIGEPPQK